MKTSSAKAKGRRLQQRVAKAIQEKFGFTDRDVKSTPMGTQGADVWLSGAAVSRFPFAIECKNTESLNIWKAWAQAQTHVEAGLNPMLVFSRNNEQTLVALELSVLLELFK